jgi:hypothetical protein
VLANLQHADDRAVGPPYKVVQGKTYHMKIERRGAIIKAWVDDHELVNMTIANLPDPYGIVLQKKYVGAKTFSLEGAETLIPMLDALCTACERLEVSPPPGGERTPQAEIYRVEAALRERGLDVRQPVAH